jgi:peptidoglycan/xylan/chitin deacetylase (PgdA/CDA1 family)
MGRKTLIAGGVTAATAFAAYAVRGKSASILAPSVYRGAQTRRSIALTFDDGPSESTPRLLETLARYHAPATFFQCGANVRRLSQIAREVAGYHEIGNHTENHPYFHFKSPDFIYAELAAAQQSIRQVVGVAPRCCRVPFGVRWFGLRQAQRRLKLTGVMWTTIGVDWKLPAKQIVTRLLRGARNGAIFCLHDGRLLQPRPDIRETIAAVQELIPILLDKGFHFEKVSEILCPTI